MFSRHGEAERMARDRGLGIIDSVVGVSLLSPPYFALYDCVSEVKNATFDISYRWIDRELMEIRKYETPVGTVTQHVTKDPAYGSYWRKKHYIESREDYKILQYIVENTIFKDRRDSVSRRKQDLGGDGVVYFRLDRSPYQKLLIELAGPDKFLVDLYTDPGPAVELMEAIGRRADEQFEIALESEAELMWLPDNVTSDMTPPNAFEKFSLPFYEKFGKQCREAGKVLLVHMDGKVNALKNLIAGAPIDVIESFSFAEMSGDMPIAETKSLWPDKVVCPNFPSSLSVKSKEEIESFLARVISEFGDKKPFMIEVSEDIPWGYFDHVLTTLTEFMSDHGKLV
jgi:hypothetical protein